MDFCGLIIQPEDLGLYAPYLKKKSTAHTHYTWKHLQFLAFQSRIIGFKKNKFQQGE